MSKSDATLAGAIAGVLALAAAGTAAADVRCEEHERCYGVVKAGMNDCATATSACSGTAKQDFQKDAWIYLSKGTCAKIGGALRPPPVAKKK